MIVKTFDQGWGPEHETKQFEISLIQRMMKSADLDPRRTVLINSVWYSGEFHQTVLEWLHKNDWDQIVLVAMLDAAIPRPEDYKEFGKPVISVGYYTGEYFVDFWSLWLNQRLDLGIYGDLTDPTDIDTAYMCLNRKPHWHRLRLYHRLESLDLLDLGLVSLGQKSGSATRAIDHDVGPDLVAPNSERLHYGIPNNINSLGSIENWRRCFFNVVTETFWDINHCNFVSEKIYKPILGQRPFVVYDTDGGSNWLKQRGFETYEHDFRDISDHTPIDPEKLVFFLKDLCAQPVGYLHSKLIELAPKIEHNFQNFQRYILKQSQVLDRGII